jgi:DNA polymerase I
MAVDQAVLSELQAVGKWFCLDMETALIPECWKGRGHVRLLQLHSDEASVWFDLATWNDEQWEALRVFLADDSLEICGHNLAFDAKVLLACGVEIAGQLYDSMICSRLLHVGKAGVEHNLAAVVRRELGKELDKTLQAQDWMAATLTEADLRYAMNDVKYCFDMMPRLHEQVDAQGLSPTYQLECELIKVVAAMELNGLYVDREMLDQAVEFYTAGKEEGIAYYVQRLDELLIEAGHDGLPRHADGTFNTNIRTSGSIRLGTKVYAGFNPGSSRQNAAAWAKLGIEPKNDKGKVSLDKKVLATYRDKEVVRLYETFKKADKRATMATKLVEHIGEDGCIHAQFLPLQTGTGRFSCSNPNLQQIPRDGMFRTCFKPEPGYVLIQADYSAMELRMLAAVAGAKEMLAAFNEGADLHTRTASLMYRKDDSQVEKDERQAAKSCNFGLAYAAAPGGLQQYFATMGLYIDLPEARKFHRMWHEAYPQVTKWHRECQAELDRGIHSRTVIGRRRQLWGDDRRVQVMANSKIQGSCADIMKSALVSIHKVLPAGAQIRATVHDEVLITARPEDADAVLRLATWEMAEAAVPMVGRAVRFEAEGGVLDSWGSK